MKLFKLNEPQPDDHPIEQTLRDTAQMLDLAIPPRLPYMTTNEAWLLQAQILQEIAKRIVAIEKR